MSYDRQQPPRHQGEYDRDKEQYDRDKEQYGRDKEQYGKDKEQYGKDKEQYGKDKEPYHPPPPPPPPCPDPCDEKPPWGPPEIRPECCPHHPCCPDEHCCTWYSVEDPCVKAASADCGLPWTKITSSCESSNKECDCEEWDCHCYPQGTCVPCKPCEGLIPDPDEPTGGCDDPSPDDCTATNLRKQLDALNQCISSQEGAKTKLEADIQARKDRATALNDLISKFDDIVKDYKTKRHTLVCREDCLKGFHRDITTVFAKYSPGYLSDLAKYVNQELCKLEQAKCCQKNLEGKLTKVTKLVWEQQQAEKAKENADKAFEIVKDLPKWLDDRFKELETLKDEIAQALNDIDPKKHKRAFYLFYWKFVPKLCRCFPFPFCCERDGGYEQPPQKYEPGSEQPPQGYKEQPPQKYPGQGSQQYQEPQYPKPPDHLGCKPGDWHPSVIAEETLRALICCAWDYARKQKQNLQDAKDRVADVNNNLTLITSKVTADEASLDDRIKSGLDKVSKSAPTSR